MDEPPPTIISVRPDETLVALKARLSAEGDWRPGDRVELLFDPATRQVNAVRISRPPGVQTQDEALPYQTIVFKNGERITYQFDKETVAQLIKDFQENRRTRVYDVIAMGGPDNRKRKLFLRFEEVLYIG